MEKDFDFKSIEKKMPYRTPDAFFDKMQEQVMERLQSEKRKKQHRMRLFISASLAVAAMLLGLIFFPAISPQVEQQPANSFIVSADMGASDSMDQFIENMSDDELAEWSELSENDIFIN